VLKSLAFIAIASYAGIAALLWLLQEKLLFHPSPVMAPARAPAGWSVDAVEIATQDGTKLAGVLVKPPGPPAPLIVYFGGNAEEVTGWAPGAASYGTRALLLVNYRGYGRSQGTPSEKAIISDALETFDWALRRPDVDASRVALMGRSLGTGVAVQVASKRPVRAAVLVSPYDSVAEVAAATYPWLPVRWLVRHPFDSMAHAASIKVAALIVTGTADTLIRPAHSKRLAQFWGGPVEALDLEGQGHNDIGGERYEAAIRGFLDRHL
jgi:uncharacterized protein